MYIDMLDTVEPEPHCDICGRHMDDSPAREIFGFVDNDWNGETGNHETCEEYLKWKESRGFDGE